LSTGWRNGQLNGIKRQEKPKEKNIGYLAQYNFENFALLLSWKVLSIAINCTEV
jgi:hypothetical protein